MKRRHFLQQTATLAAALIYPTPPSDPRRPLTGWMAYADNHNAESFWQQIRAQFPLRRDRIYFNSGGLGPSPEPGLRVLAQKMREVDEVGETGHEVFDHARLRVAKFVGADPAEIAFTRNATEGMNIIARGIRLRPGDEVLTTYHEHPGGAIPWLAAARDAGAIVRLIELPNNPDELVDIVERSLTAQTRVFMMSHVPCTTGTIFPMAELCGFLRNRRVISVLDGAQAVGMAPVSVHDLGCDFYTSSGHKWLLGPKESGFVYMAQAAHEFFQPTFVGAYSDTRYDLDSLVLDLRKTAQVSEYGTRNAASIYGFLAVLEFLEEIGWEKIYMRQRQLSRQLLEGLHQIANVEILTSTKAGAYGGIVTFRMNDVVASQVTTKLQSEFAMRVRHITEHHLEACRISMHIFNFPHEVDKLIYAVQEIARGKSH